MKDTYEKIIEKYKDSKVEILLMFVFVCFFFIIAGPEIAREASSGKAVLETETETMQSETETEPETETELVTEEETEPETETRQELLLRERQARLKLGKDFVIPMEMPRESADEGLRTLEDSERLRGYELPERQSQEVSIGLLQEELEGRLEEYDGDWSVYVKNLSTDESFVINDRPMKSASVMKLFIMGTVYRAFDTGELERTDEIMALMNDMISYSDNEDSNELLYRLGGGSYERGIAQVDEFIQEYGFSEMTREYNGFNNPATNTGTGNYNQVSARDCGKLLEDIYHRTWVSRAVSNEMEEMLLAQNTRYKIPAGLPEGVLCGNKTGEMDTTENDAALIYADQCDYILVILSSDWNSKDEAISRIRTISSVTYEHLAEVSE